MRTVLQRCLEKDPKQRIGDIGDVQLALSGGFDSPTQPIVQQALARRPLWKRVAPAAAALILVGALSLIAGFNTRPVTPSPKVTRFSVTLPPGELLPNGARSMLALAADGTQMVYVSNGRLNVRAMSQFDARTIPGTEGMSIPVDPVFSPDGQSIAFFTLSDSSVKRIAVTGGAPVTICSADATFGMSWGIDGIAGSVRAVTAFCVSRKTAGNLSDSSA